MPFVGHETYIVKKLDLFLQACGGIQTLQPIQAPLMEAAIRQHKLQVSPPDGLGSDRSWSSGYGSINSPSSRVNYDNVRGDMRGPFVSYQHQHQPSGGAGASSFTPPPPPADEILMVSNDCDSRLVSWATAPPGSPLGGASGLDSRPHPLSRGDDFSCDSMPASPHKVRTQKIQSVKIKDSQLI